MMYFLVPQVIVTTADRFLNFLIHLGPVEVHFNLVHDLELPLMTVGLAVMVLEVDFLVEFSIFWDISAIPI